MNKTYLLSGSWDSSIIIWKITPSYSRINEKKDYETPEFLPLCYPIGELQGHSKSVNSILIPPYNTIIPNLLISGGADRCIKVWNLKDIIQNCRSNNFTSSVKKFQSTYDLSPIYEMQLQPIHSIQEYRYEGEYLVSCTNGIHIMQLHKSNQEMTTSSNVDYNLSKFDWMLSITSSYFIYRIFHPLLQDLVGDPVEIISILYIRSPLTANDQLIVGINRDVLCVIYLSIWKAVRQVRGHSAPCDCLLFLKETSSMGLLVSGSRDKNIRVWSRQTASSDWICLRCLSGHEGFVLSLSAVPFHTCDLLLSGSSDTTIRMWDIKKGICLRIFSGHLRSVRAVTAIPVDLWQKSFWVVSASNDANIKVWNPANGKCMETLEKHVSNIVSLSFFQAPEDDFLEFKSTLLVDNAFQDMKILFHSSSSSSSSFS